MDKWDKRFIEMAELVAGWSSCLKTERHVGAVIVKEKRILTTGYNGAPAGVKSCIERGVCMRQTNKIESGTRIEQCYAVHAEQNAIVQAARLGVSLVGASIYQTHSPCSICAKMIINSGIKRIVYIEKYPDDLALGILEEAGVTVEQYKK